jgi:hypothetical protein
MNSGSRKGNRTKMEKLRGYTLVPAYGRDYKSKREVIEALNSGKTFRAEGIGGSGYCSIRDLADGDVSVRWKKLTMQAILTVKNGKVVQ